MSIQNLPQGPGWFKTLQDDLNSLDPQSTGWTDSGVTMLNGFHSYDNHPPVKYCKFQIGNTTYLAVSGTVKTDSTMQVVAQHMYGICMVPVTGLNRLVSGYAYLSNQSNTRNVHIYMNGNNGEVDFTNISGDAFTFTSIDFAIILTLK